MRSGTKRAQSARLEARAGPSAASPNVLGACGQMNRLGAPDASMARCVSSAGCGKLVFALLALELGYLTLPYLIVSCRILSDLVLSYLILSYLILSYLILSYRNSLSRPVETILELILGVAFWTPETRFFDWIFV